MYDDGSSQIEEAGDEEPFELGYGEGATLSGGQAVAGNYDGSLGITADAADCRSTLTLLRGTPDGVDVVVRGGKNPLCGYGFVHEWIP
jgi:hypothetical protein